MRSLIGIPCHATLRVKSRRPVYGNNRACVHAIEDAGGISVLIPFLKDLDDLDEILDRLDGILLTGGMDIQPLYYDEAPHPLLQSLNPQLDELEFTLVRRALQRDMPVLGLCRGMQVLNVALGGSLYQNLDDTFKGIQHMHSGMYANSARTEVIHQIYIKPGSRMETILGTRECSVNSLHHQALKRLGRGVRVTGVAEDNVAEAIEVEGQRFAIGMQSHPEEIYRQVSACARLFEAFVDAADRYAAGRGQSLQAARA